MLENEIKMMNKSDKKELIARLSRIEGQIRGIIRMIENEESCELVIHQLAAANQALHKAFVNVISKVIKNNVNYDSKSSEKLIYISDLLEKYL
ncbi:MAG: metal-sensitive transcriptional regulator [bacterium]